MQVPSSLCGDFLAADRASPCLPLPDDQELSESAKTLCHFGGIALFEVFLVRWIKRICRAKYFDMTLNLHV
jgi:hypothetical protein